MILVVDDEQLITQLMEKVFHREGYKVVTAHNGIQAINQYNPNRKDLGLIITDHDMPVMNGIELIQAIRSYGDQIPILAWSGRPEQEKPMLQAGANAFLEKPPRLTTLIDKVRELYKQDESL